MDYKRGEVDHIVAGDLIRIKEGIGVVIWLEKMGK
jgi:hypothetical protein